MGRSLFDFFRREDGVVAVIFAVMAIPFIAMAGWAVDYLRLEHVRERLQIEADAAALNAQSSDWPMVKAAATAHFSSNYNGDWARNPIFDGVTLPSGLFQVTAEVEVPLAFIKILPGIGETQRVRVAALSRSQEIARDYDIEVTELDYDAGDYNRIWAYCYWPNRPQNDPDRPKRTQMVPIADNGGPATGRNQYERDDGAPQIGLAIHDGGLAEKYDRILQDNPREGYDGQEEGAWRRLDEKNGNSRRYIYVAPLCSGESYLSFRLENVRFAREQPEHWENDSLGYNHTAPRNGGGDGHWGRYNYYTDSVLDPVTNVETYEGLVLPRPHNGRADILETVLCDTKEQCKPDDPRSIIPSGSGRQEGRPNERQRASQGCSPGKYMYYGFEDRPPGLPGGAHDWQWEAWTDADYDDIRIIIRCPEIVTSGERNVMLVG